MKQEKQYKTKTDYSNFDKDWTQEQKEKLRKRIHELCLNLSESEDIRKMARTGKITEKRIEQD